MDAEDKISVSFGNIHEVLKGTAIYSFVNFRGWGPSHLSKDLEVASKDLNVTSQDLGIASQELEYLSFLRRF